MDSTSNPTLQQLYDAYVKSLNNNNPSTAQDAQSALEKRIQEIETAYLALANELEILCLEKVRIGLEKNNDSTKTNFSPTEEELTDKIKKLATTLTQHPLSEIQTLSPVPTLPTDTSDARNLKIMQRLVRMHQTNQDVQGLLKTDIPNLLNNNQAATAQHPISLLEQLRKTTATISQEHQKPDLVDATIAEEWRKIHQFKTYDGQKISSTEYDSNILQGQKAILPEIIISGDLKKGVTLESFKKYLLAGKCLEHKDYVTESKGDTLTFQSQYDNTKLIIDKKEHKVSLHIPLPDNVSESMGNHIESIQNLTHTKSVDGSTGQKHTQDRLISMAIGSIKEPVIRISMDCKNEEDVKKFLRQSNAFKKMGPM